jgi:hypothetical protein
MSDFNPLDRAKIAVHRSSFDFPCASTGLHSDDGLYD